MKKLIILIAIILIIIGGVYYYQASNNNYPEKYTYPEITEEVLNTIGGQEIADKLIANFEESDLALKDAIDKYKAGGSLEEDKPGIRLFTQLSRNAQYIRKYDLAIETLESVFDYYETSDIALVNLASIYEAKGEYQQAIDTYLRFYDMFGAQIQQHHVNIIKDYMALDDKDNVIKYYEEFKAEGYSSEEIEHYIANS